MTQKYGFEELDEIEALTAFQHERPRWGMALGMSGGVPRRRFLAAHELTSPPTPEASEEVQRTLLDLVIGPIRTIGVNVLDYRSLERDLRAAREDIAEIQATLEERPTVRPTWLFNVGDPTITVVVPIPIVLEEYESETLARWPEVEATGVGATEAEAINELRQDIADLYKDLASSEPETLAPRIALTRDVLLRTLKS